MGPTSTDSEEYVSNLVVYDINPFEMGSMSITPEEDESLSRVNVFESPELEGPRTGMIYRSLDSVIHAYQEYARNCGFNAVRRTGKKNRYALMVCSKSLKVPLNLSRQRAPCPARLNAIGKPDGSWIISSFHPIHNHALDQQLIKEYKKQQQCESIYKKCVCSCQGSVEKMEFLWKKMTILKTEVSNWTPTTVLGESSISEDGRTISFCVGGFPVINSEDTRKRPRSGGDKYMLDGEFGPQLTHGESGGGLVGLLRGVPTSTLYHCLTPHR